MGFLSKHANSVNLKSEDLPNQHEEYIVTVQTVREEMIDFQGRQRPRGEGHHHLPRIR